MAGVDEWGKRGYCWIVGDCSETQFDTKCRMNPRRNNGPFQGITTEAEEIIVSADIRQRKNVCPDVGEQHLRFCSRSFTLTVLKRGKRNLTKRFTINPVTPVWEAVQKHDSRRHHV